MVDGNKVVDVQTNISQYTKDIYRKGGFLTQAQRMLRLFQMQFNDGDGWVPTEYLRKIASQYSARLNDIRQGRVDGVKYDIVSERRNGVFGFRYRGRY